MTKTQYLLAKLAEGGAILSQLALAPAYLGMGTTNSMRAGRVIDAHRDISMIIGMLQDEGVLPVALPGDLPDEDLKELRRRRATLVAQMDEVLKTWRVVDEKAVTKSGWQLICDERQRQIQGEGYDATHDDNHTDGEIEAAADCYAEAGTAIELGFSVVNSKPPRWSWSWSHWKPGSPKENFIKAGALYLAEADRLDRARKPDKVGLRRKASDLGLRVDHYLRGGKVMDTRIRKS